MFTRTILLSLVALPLAACSATQPQVPANTNGTQSEPTADPSTASKLDAALAGPARPPQERARDVYRHPKETLAFFGLRDDMHVLELAPGAGWYTAILAPVLRERGLLTITSADPQGPADDESAQFARKLFERFTSAKDTFDKVQPLIQQRGQPPQLGPDGSYDMVVTFRSVHNWVAAERLPLVLAAIHKALKPGGILGVEAHRANPGAPTDAKSVDKSGYLPEAFVIEQIEAAGFKLAGRSDINANPKDSKDHPKGVWTLPPTFELGQTDHDKYAAIGESDRMTLKFVKR
jgi:predicted methyltransferase